MTPATDDDALLLNAYVDGELDAAAALAFERRMAESPALKAAFERVTALRKSIAANLQRDQASEMLRMRIMRGAGEPAQDAAGAARRFSWRQMAAAAAIAAVLASGATVMALRPTAHFETFAAIVAGHERSLLAASPVDVVSSDRHTVKPWFDARLAISPPVPDLAAAGFALEGGRVEIINGKPAPTLVYRLNKHLISLLAMPTPGGADDGAAPARQTQDGYTVLTWRGQDFTYAAVSDAATADLENFQSRWRKAVAAE